MWNKGGSRNAFGLVQRKQGSRSGLRPALKEKFVSLYEDIFACRSPIQTARDEGFAGRQALQRFWDELLLLKVNEAYLAQCVARIPEDQLVGPLRSTITELFGTCVRYLNNVNFIRVAHALETLAVLLREIFRKRFSEQGYTIITLVAGSAENSDPFFKRLISDVAALVARDDVPVLIKALGLRLYLVILTATDNVNTNSIASYLFVHNICDALLAVLTIKIPDERQRLELDACLVLLLLLLWRESSNPYADWLASPSGPLLPLLHTASSLLSRPNETRAIAPGPMQSTSPGTPTGTAAAATAAEMLMGYANTWLGFAPPPGSLLANGPPDGAGVEAGIDLGWSNVTAGILLVYFLVYLNPLMKSSTVWPSSGFAAGPGHSLALLWGDVFRSFLSLLREIFSSNNTAEPGGALQAKISLVILRCLLEDRLVGDFLFRCDPTTFLLVQIPDTPSTLQGAESNGSITHVAPLSLTCVILDMVIDLLSNDPATSATQVDPDLYLRGDTLVAIVFNSVKARGRPLSSTAVKWEVLWKGLVRVCDWCSAESNFQRPGVPEVAEATLGILESCLGSGQEVIGRQEDVEEFHAVTLANTPTFEALGRTAERIPFGGPAVQSMNGGIKLVNIRDLKIHYEVQVAAMGVRGIPTEAQAIAAVRRKGMSSLKLRARHTGPAHAYTERTSEHRILTGLTRLLVTQHRRHFWASMPKFELESM